MAGPESAATEEPARAFDESRRLTGPNRYFANPAVVLTPLGAAAGDVAAHARWAEHVRALAARLPWPDPQPLAHRHAQGAFLAFAAPEDALFTATEVNEWAWEVAAAQTAGDLHAQGLEPLYAAWPGLDDAAAEFARRASHERSRPLARLRAAAHAHALPCIEDDDTVSLGAGTGSRTWPRAALPLPMDVPWRQLHDVPTLLVTGSNGKTTTSRLLAAIGTRMGLTAGVCSTEGVVVGGETVASGDYAGPAGARVVLRHPAVQWAVLETARGGLLRRGLAVRRAVAAIVTNVSADHLGEYGIANVDDIAEVKLTVAHAVQHGGSLVLNGADPVLLRAARRLPHVQGTTQALFAPDADHPELVAHRDAGGATCGVREGRLHLQHAAEDHDLGAIDAMPLTLGGAAAYNIENLAAAALGAWAAGAPIEALRHTFATFGAHPQDNPGRLERYDYRGATVLIDYAHNPDGLAQLLRVARALKPRRLGLLLGQAGNRDDAAIAELARVAAEAKPDLVVVKELPGMLRGRALGEVTRLLVARLEAAGVKKMWCEGDEELGARLLLKWADCGDVIVLPLHTAGIRGRIVTTWLFKSEQD